MNISYRLKKKELILLLDLFGDACTLEQKFGDVYISRADYESIAASLHEKGYVTVNSGRITADSAAELIIKKMYSSEYVLEDTEVSGWLYCSEDITLFIDFSTVFRDEFRIRTVLSEEDRKELSEELTGRTFSILRGGNGTVSGADAVFLTGDKSDEKK